MTFSEAFSTGRGFGWHQRTAEHWHGTDAFTRVALPTDLIAAAIDQLGDVASVLTSGGSVVDVGCGYGTPTLGIAELYPAATVLGIDYHDASIAHARAEAAATGVGNARFEVVAATELAGGDYDLITFFDSLHDIGDRRCGTSRGQGSARIHRCVVGVRADGRRRRAGQPHPGRSNVLRRLDARVHTQCGLAADGHLIGAAGRPSR